MEHTSARKQLRLVEQRLLAGIPDCSVADVPVSNGATVHHIKLQLDPSKDDVLVMLGGYGLGAGLFCLTLDIFSKRRSEVPFGSVFALDSPGSGLCSPFAPADDAISLEGLITYASDAIDEWRAATGLSDSSRVTLFGHSLGGYLAFRYCESRGVAAAPKHLILASCFGVPTFPASRTPPWSEQAWLAKKASDLKEGKRARTMFDRGSSNSRVRIFFTMLSCCLPCLLLGGIVARLYSFATSSRRNPRTKAVVSPVIRVSGLLGCSWLRWLVIRYFGMRRCSHAPRLQP